MKQYNEYKDSGIEWLGQIPAHWEVVKLKYNANISFSSVDRHVYDEERKVSICHYPEAYKNEQINSTIKLSKGSCKEQEFERFQLKEGQVIITKDSESADDIGVPAYVAETFENGVCGYHLAILEAKNALLLGKYIFRYIQSSPVKYFFETNVNGVTRVGLGKPTIGNLLILMPPQKEQEKITQFLDHQTQIIDALVAKKEALIEKLQLQRQTIINEAVTKGLHPDAPMKDSGIEWLGEIPAHWEVAKLKYLVDKVGSGVTPRGGSTVYTEEGVYLLRSQNIYSDGLRLENCVRIPEAIHEKMKGSQVQYGDVLLNITGASIGRVFYWNKKSIEANVNQHVCIIRVNDRVIFQYIQGFLAAEIGQLQIFSGQDGTSREGLNFEELKNFVVVLPPLQEQTEIVSFIDQQTQLIDQLISKTKTQIEKLKTYRQTIISEAVTGKIDVSGWAG